MSMPPQLIRVKRKRDDESPVTFLQLDEDAKRYRKGNTWVYRRRDSTVPAATASAVARSDAKPVIHVSRADEGVPVPTTVETLSTARPTDAPNREPRKFHVSRAMLSQAPPPSSPSSQGAGAKAGSWKQAMIGPTVFVERNRKKTTPSSCSQQGAAPSRDGRVEGTEALVEQRRLRKPGVANRSRDASRDGSHVVPTRSLLPSSRPGDDLDKITADMNEWVLDEIGANLRCAEQEAKRADGPRFRPRAPEKRYQERHPQQLLAAPLPPAARDGTDTHMADASEEEGNDDDWIIEEYVRIPAHSMALNVSPSDIGILVLDGEKENMLFYGPPQDDDDEAEEDDEDENGEAWVNKKMLWATAENHYTADYPEDEVDSDDEFDRHAYMFRNGNASDDEEFDDDDYDDDSDDMVMQGDEDDDDARMSRIQEFMMRNMARS